MFVDPTGESFLLACIIAGIIIGGTIGGISAYNNNESAFLGALRGALIGGAIGAFAGAAGAAMFAGSFTASCGAVFSGLNAFGSAIASGGLASGGAYIWQNIQKAFGFGSQVISSTANKLNTIIHEGKQGKHILGHNNFIEGRSILYGSIGDAQVLVNKFAGTGRFINEFKEIINFGKVIGQYMDITTGNLIETTRVIIIYSQSGCHIVPANPFGW